MIPIIDDRIKHVGPTYLRTLNAQSLAELTEMVVVQDSKSNAPLAVIIPYKMYLELQSAAAGTDHLTELVPELSALLDKFHNVAALAAEEDARALALTSPEDKPNASFGPYGQLLGDNNGMLPVPGGPPDPNMNHCIHCGQNFERNAGALQVTLCPPCFIAGHRNGPDCQQCTEYRL